MSNVTSSGHPPGRALYLPLEKLDNCSKCGKSSKDVKLRICMACGEALYCSNGCQKADWKSHKVFCGETDRVDLESFYPLLALLRHHFHTRPDVRAHPALTHQIVNNPLSLSSVVLLPNGVSTSLIILGDRLTRSNDLITEKWWPSSPSPQARSKLMRRIISEGMVLSSIMALTIALVAEVYTTTAAPKSDRSRKRRVRLSYNNSPISDIGIVHGSVRVTAQDRLAYYNFTTDEFIMGQDPEDHYWIYFTTLAGDEYFLDCGMLNFNFSTMVDTTQHGAAISMPEILRAPAFFYNHHYEKAMPLLKEMLFLPTKKVSIMRDCRLHDFMKSGGWAFCDDCDVPNVRSVMNDISGRACSPSELEMVGKLIPEAILHIRRIVEKRAYLDFPSQPLISIDRDPEEEKRDLTGENAEDLYAHLTKWSRKLKKGKISPEKWRASFKRYTDAHRDHSAGDQSLALSRTPAPTANLRQVRSGNANIKSPYRNFIGLISRLAVCVILVLFIPYFVGRYLFL